MFSRKTLNRNEENNVEVDVSATKEALKTQLKIHIKQVMRQKGITQGALSFCMGTQQPQISRILSVQDSSASIDYLITCLLSIGGVFIAKVGSAGDVNKLRYKITNDDHLA